MLNKFVTENEYSDFCFIIANEYLVVQFKSFKNELYEN